MLKEKERLSVGDLVRWTFEGGEDLGIIIPLTEIYKRNPVLDGHVSIHWFGNPQHSGHYPSNHHYLELLSATS